jgi:threonine dehydrogenase-like Zn-dependent dehydrogenase
MRGLFLDERPRLVDDLPLPVPSGDEAVVRVRRAGVCDTDLALAAGYMRYRGVLGHEFVGVVDEDGSDLAGRRVVADINAGCGECEDCRRRDGHHCAQRTVLGILGRHGAFAERLAIPRRNLVPVPDVVSDDAAVFAEPLAAAFAVLDVLPPDPAPPIVVLGDGKLGLLIAFALRSAGREVISIGHHAEKLALAEAVGARTMLESELDESASPRLETDAVIEATGSAGGLRRALALVRPRGTIVLKTTIAGPTEVDLSPVVVNELRVLGSRCGDMRRAVAALASGRVDPTALIVDRFGLDRAERALARAGEPGVLKVLIDVAEDPDPTPRSR